MLKHSLLIFFRSLKRYKSAAAINLFGLSIGLASALLIFLWVNDELHMDQFSEQDSDRHYQVFENTKYPKGIVTKEKTSNPLAKGLAEEFPEVEYGVRIMADPFYEGVLSFDDYHFRARANFVDQEYFNLFRCDFVAGDKGRALNGTRNVVISEKLAKGFFRDPSQAIGKTVVFKHKFFTGPYEVTGVYKRSSDISAEYDILFSYESFLAGRPEQVHWWAGGTFSHIVLQEGTDLESFNAKIKNFLSKFKETEQEIFAQKFSERYLYGNYENGVPVAGRMVYVRIFALIAIFVLIIACINYMNLSTAQASRRIKEIGVKKAIGAQRHTLIYQYFRESMFMTFLALILAIGIVSLLLNQFNEITGKQLVISDALSLSLPIFIITLITGLIAGIYPGLYLSSFKPVLALKGKVGTGLGGLWLRKGLVVFQFAISVILIISVIFVYRQMEYIQTANLGYDTEHVLSFRRVGSLAEGDEAFMAEVRNIPGVVNLAFIAGNLPGAVSGASGLRWKDQDPEEQNIRFDFVEGGHGLGEVMGVELVAGRLFSEEYPSDINAVVLNETAVKLIGYDDPVGKRFWAWKDCEIIGVVKDFHIAGMQEQIGPLFFRLNSNSNTYMAKIAGENQSETIDRIEQLYTTFNPGYPFEFKFLDDEYQKLYDEERRVATLSKYFAVIAIAISCLGLLALTAFSTQRRFKEIAIRKVLGSSRGEIIRLLSREFLVLVIIGILIALPIGYILMRNWLDGFAYRIGLDPVYLILAGVAMVVIAWITIMIQTAKSAVVNVTSTLRRE